MFKPQAGAAPSCGKAIRAGALAAACAALAACGLQTPPVDVAQAPPGAFGSNGDSDVAAVNIASWGFSASRNLRNRPVEAARSVAAVDYLAGQFNNSGRWDTISPIVQMDMLQARRGGPRRRGHRARRTFPSRGEQPVRATPPRWRRTATRRRRRSISPTRRSPSARRQRRPGWEAFPSCRPPTSPPSARWAPSATAPAPRMAAAGADFQHVRRPLASAAIFPRVRPRRPCYAAA